jgi:hypothetical protein
MGGVDLQDQVTALFPIIRGTVKGYRKIFFYLLDMCIFSAFTVHRKITNKKKPYTDFRVDIASKMLETEAASVQHSWAPGIQYHTAKITGQKMGPLPNARPNYRKEEKCHEKMCVL